jgi:excisionase family DNA binding protein
MSNPFSQMRFLTVSEVADMMRVSTMTVYRMVHSGELPAVRFGRSFRIPETAVSQIIFSTGGDQNLNQVG